MPEPREAEAWLAKQTTSVDPLEAEGWLKKQQGSIPEPVDAEAWLNKQLNPPPPGIMDSVASSGRMAWNAAVGGIGSVERAVGTVLGGVGVPGADYLKQRGQELMTPVPGEEAAPQFTDVWANPTPKKAIDFITTSVAGTLPQMATVAAGGLATAGTVVGPLAGAFATGWVIEAGNDYQDLVEQGVKPEEAAKIAGFTGAAKGILEAAPIVGRIGGKLFFKGADDVAEGFVKKVAKDAAVEGGTEAGQELVGIGGEYYGGIRKPFNEQLARVLNAAAAGAVAGPIVGVGVDLAMRQGEKQLATEVAAPNLAGVDVPVKTDQEIVDEKEEDQKDAVEATLAAPLAERNPALQLQDKIRETHGEDFRKKMMEVWTEADLRKVLEIPEDLETGAALKAFEEATQTKLIKPVEGGYKFTELARDEFNWFENVLVDPQDPAGNFPNLGPDQYQRQQWQRTVQDLAFEPTVEGTTVPIRLEVQNAADYDPVVLTDLARNPFVKSFAGTVDKFRDKATKLIAAAPEFQGLANAFNLPYHLKNTAMLMQEARNEIVFGKFLSGAANGYLGMSPFAEYKYRYSSPPPAGTSHSKWAATRTWGTFAHELTHSLVLGHADNFNRTELLVLQALKPLESEFINEMEAVYDTDGIGGFGSGVRSAHREFQQGIARQETGNAVFEEEPGFSSSAGSQTGGGVSSQAGAQPGDRQKRSRGAEAGGAERYQLRGDFPSASPEYSSLVEEVWRRDQIVASQERMERGDADEGSNPVVDEMVSSLVKIPGLSKQAKQSIYSDTVKYGKFARHGLFLQQVWDRNRNLPPLVNYVNGVRRFWVEKVRVVMRHDIGLKKDWPFTAKNAMKVTKLIEAVTLKSMDQRRRLSDVEVQQIAAAQGSSKFFNYWKGNDTRLRETLDDLEKASIAHAQQVYGPVLSPVIVAKLQGEFAAMRNRNYFPFTRFGRFAVTVKATKATTFRGQQIGAGKVAYFAGHDGKKDQEKDFREIYAEIRSNPDLQVRHSEINDAMQEFIGFPPALFDILATKANLTPQQLIDVKDLMMAMAPGRSFMKHMRAKKGVQGYSEDFQRSLAGYAQSASNHIAKLKHGFEIDQALKDLREIARQDPFGSTQYDAMYKGLLKHKEDLFNPGDSLGWLRGFLTLHYFWAMPSQLLVNTMQLPMKVFPYMAKRHPSTTGIGDWKVAKHMGKAIWDSMRQWKDPNVSTLEPDVSWAMQQLQERGQIEQGYATEIAGIREHGTLSRGLVPNSLMRAWRWGMDAGLKVMSIPEKNNRRVTAIAMMRMAMQDMGMTREQALEWTDEGITWTNNVFERWAKPEAMRGKIKPVLTLFKSYPQQEAYFAFTNKGGWRYWAVAAGMAGLGAFPFSKDIMSLASILGTTLAALFGVDDPRFDAEEFLREKLEWVGANPDLFMHGASRHMFGMTPLLHLAGVPAPDLDFSGQLSAGEIIGEDLIDFAVGGGIGLAANAIKQPQLNPVMGQNPEKLFFKALMRVGGPATSYGFNLVKAAANDEPMETAHWLSMIAPRQVKNVLRAYEAATQEAVLDSRGRPLVNFNPEDPQQFMEIIGMAAGAPPAALGQKMEAYMAYSEKVTYYRARREWLMSAYTYAIQNEEPEAIADTRKAIQDANNEFPAEFRITGEQLVRSVRASQRSENLRTAGFPAQIKYKALKDATEKLYPVPSGR